MDGDAIFSATIIPRYIFIPSCVDVVRTRWRWCNMFTYRDPNITMRRFSGIIFPSNLASHRSSFLFSLATHLRLIQSWLFNWSVICIFRVYSDTNIHLSKSLFILLIQQSRAVLPYHYQGRSNRNLWASVVLLRSEFFIMAYLFFEFTLISLWSMTTITSARSLVVTYSIDGPMVIFSPSFGLCIPFLPHPFPTLSYAIINQLIN